MRTLELNLASLPFRNNTPIWVGHGTLLAVVLGFTAWNAHTAVTASRNLATLQADMGSAARQLQELDRREAEAVAGARQFDPKIMQVQADKANDIILRRGLSWTRLFNTLEKVVPYEVRMTAIHPDYDTRARATASGSRDKVFAGTVPVNVEGFAQSLEAFLELERSLIVDPHFANVEPVRTESPKGSAEIAFQLHFLYDPEGKVNGEHPELPHVLEAARKNAEDGGEAPPSALEGLK